MQPTLKTKVTDLVKDDPVLIEDEFGEFYLGYVERYSPNHQLIKVDDYFFYVDTGQQYTRWETENTDVVVGRYTPAKSIHRGDGQLFTEVQRSASFRKRNLQRDRKKLIGQIKQATVSDWLLFTDEELVEIVRKLSRLDHLELKVISHDPKNQTEPDRH